MRPTCGCGSTDVQKRGTRKGLFGRLYQRYQCNSCGDWGQSPIKNSRIAGAKILVLDIETLPSIGYFWRPWKTSIYENQVIKDWCMLSWAAKWLGDNRAMSDVLTPEESKNRNDKRISESIWKLVDEADVVITHNGKRFDIKKLNTRFWKHGLKKPSSAKVIDTLTTARSVFGLTYNSQDAIARFKSIQTKLDTDFDLWIRCDRGEKRSLQYMREYNENDIFMLEDIYMSMREWIPNHPNLAVYAHQENACPVCLSSKIKKSGIYTARKRQYQEYRCGECNSLWHDTKYLR